MLEQAPFSFEKPRFFALKLVFRHLFKSAISLNSLRVCEAPKAFGVSVSEPQTCC
jgi:hypothetical protein